MIAKLKRLNLRKLCPKEAKNFTPWLEDNIDVLSDTINRNIVNVVREEKTESKLRVDLVAEYDGGLIVIENQFEKSNHDHLGKLITYLTAMQANIAVWIVEDPRPEHVGAINWLNESLNVDFYLVKIEAVQIEESSPAPLLTLIAGPSEEQKSIGRSKQERSERQKLLKNWWSNLLQHSDAKLHQHLTPVDVNWISVGSGTSGITFNYQVLKTEIRAVVYIYRGKDREEENQTIYQHFYNNKESIEKQFNGELVWENPETAGVCKIQAKVEGGYGDPEKRWEEIFGQITSVMNRLVKSVEPHLKTLNLN